MGASFNHIPHGSNLPLVLTGTNCLFRRRTNLTSSYSIAVSGIYTNHIDSNDQREREGIQETLPSAILLLGTPSTNARRSTSIQERRPWQETGEGMAASPSSRNVRFQQNQTAQQLENATGEL
jgi:hypothetical protein